MSQTTVLHVGGLHWATSERAVETALLRRPGVEAVEANALNQTASVTFDPSATSLGELAGGCVTAGTTARDARCPTTSARPRRRPPRASGATSTMSTQPTERSHGIRQQRLRRRTGSTPSRS